MPSSTRLIVGFLVLATLAGYWPVREAGFIILDDPRYVSENPRIQEGLTRNGVQWAFRAGLLESSRYADYWRPLSFLSHMVDVEFFGLAAQYHHVENVLIHLANTLLLFGVLRGLTGAVWRSGLVAAVFALHPLHVEAVAWISERKEVLGGLFWMLTLWAYGWYARRPGIWRYLAVVATLALGLMSKPVGMVLPVVLLLLDWWPLGRMRRGTVVFLVVEKFPLLVLSGISVGITMRAGYFLHSDRCGNLLAWVSSVVTSQEPTGTMAGESGWEVVGWVVVRYATYVAKAVAPTDLAVWHPPWSSLPAGWVAGAAGLLGLISGACWWMRRERPYLAVGWLWLVFGLLPVITLKDTAWAERFTYLPLIGLSIMLAWGLPEGWFAAGWRQWAGWGVVGVGVVGMAVGTWRQACYWRNSIAFFERTLAVTGEDNWFAHYNLGSAFMEQGRVEEALRHFHEALRLRPNYAPAHNNLGFALVGQGRIEEGIAHLQRAVELHPDHLEAQYNLGSVLTQVGRTPEAIRHFREVLRLEPEFPAAHYNWGIALIKQGRDDEAIRHFREALRLKPDFLDAGCRLGRALARRGSAEEAARVFRQALAVDPNCESALEGLAWILATADETARRDRNEAVQLAGRACRLTRRQSVPPLMILAAAYADAGRFAEAIATARESLALAEAKGDPNLKREIEAQLAFYRRFQPFRRKGPTGFP